MGMERARRLPWRACDRCEQSDHCKADSRTCADQAQMPVPVGCDERLSRLNRTATDRAYMIEALAQMLGPKARLVWASWQDQGVQRIHSDWVIDPMSMDGEDVAQVHLDMHEAMKSAVVVEDVDAYLADCRAATATPTQPHQGRGDVT
jgi:hypothetical protein